jgi:hypothetical protein
MKNIKFLCSLLIVSAISHAQLSFESLSFEKALQKASIEGKYLMVVLDSKDCDQCNEVADKAFSDNKLGESLSEKYISIRLKPGQEEWTRMTQQYDAPSGTVTLFFASNGVLLRRYNGTASFAKKYADEAQLAIDNEIEVINIKSLTNAWEQDTRNISLIQPLLLKRKQLWLSTDSLLDIYVQLLPVDSFQSFSQLQFIASFSPVLGSKADSLLRKDYDLFNQAWYRLDLPTRIRINNTIISKTRHKAIRKRDENLAIRVATFASSTNTNTSARQRSYALNLMEYYLGIADTVRYINYAKNYYNRFLMTIQVDSILKKDSIDRERLLAMAKTDTIRTTADKYQVRKTVGFRPIAQFYMQELNDAAWSFYTMTNDSLLLKTALGWSERANMFYKSSRSLDTFARLLYKTGKKNHAINAETEAVALQSKLGYPTKQFDEILLNMKAGKEKIDQY